MDPAGEAYDAEALALEHGLTDDALDELALMPWDRRRDFFRHYLTTDEVIFAEVPGVDTYLEGRLLAGQMLRQQAVMGCDEEGRRLVHEANEVYYGENEFRVQLYCLGDFVRNDGGDANPPRAVAGLVKRRFTIEMELHDIWHSAETDGIFVGVDCEAIDYTEEENRDVARWTRGKLRYALQLTEVESMRLELLGAGLLDGSDFATRLTIKDIASLVRKLIVQFGARFDITKRLTRGDRAAVQSLRHYWDAPSDAERQSVRDGRATAEATMRVEIARWLDEDTREPGPDGEWDRLV